MVVTIINIWKVMFIGIMYTQMRIYILKQTILIKYRIIYLN